MDPELENKNSLQRAAAQYERLKTRLVAAYQPADETGPKAPDDGITLQKHIIPYLEAGFKYQQALHQASQMKPDHSETVLVRLIRTENWYNALCALKREHSIPVNAAIQIFQDHIQELSEQLHGTEYEPAVFGPEVKEELTHEIMAYKQSISVIERHFGLPPTEVNKHLEN